MTADRTIIEPMSHRFTILGRGKAGHALADALGGAVALDAHSADPAGPVLLALPDAAIAGRAVRFLGRCCHLSGSLHVEGVPSLHPLTSFGGAAADWRGVPLAVTGGPPKVILDAFISLGFAPFSLPAELKPLYHACAVMASGHAAALLLAAESMLKGAGIILPGRGLLGLAEAALRNAAELGPAGLTGPFVRRDDETIRRDAQALPERWRGLFVDLGGMVQTAAEDYVP
jgi:predicted short-subunit dehydrogenase-like oxidoreductase (DUF2520 family)